MSDGMAWLAEPRALAYGGYGIVLARGLGPGELVARLARVTRGGPRTARFLGEFDSAGLAEELDEEYGGDPDEPVLRTGEGDGWVFAVMHGLWQGEFESLAPVSRDGAHVFHLEYEEENGKPVPPFFRSFRDGRLRCGLNLHLDRSWGEEEGELAGEIMGLLAAAGLPSEGVPSRSVHRAVLEVLGARFGLGLSRRRVLDDALPAFALEAD